MVPTRSSESELFFFLLLAQWLWHEIEQDLAMPAQEIERSSKQALLSCTVSLKDRAATKYPSPFLSQETSGNGLQNRN